jgi:site-specific DNA-cytosine methylase
VILDVIFNEVDRYALHVLEKNFEINRIQVDVIVLYVKVMK